MTPDEKEAIRAHVAKGGNIGPVDAAALLAEVDRLTASGPAQATAAWNWAIENERARILAAVEGLPEPERAITWGTWEQNGWDAAIAAVIAIVKGEK